MTDSKFGMSLYTSATTIHEGHAVNLVSTAGYPHKGQISWRVHPIWGFT